MAAPPFSARALHRLSSRPPLRALIASRRSLTLSAVEGPTHPPLASSTLSEYFRTEILEKHARRPALICRSEKPGSHAGPPSRNLKDGPGACLAWDFDEFDRHVGALARGMISMGVNKGDRVGVIMGNNSAYACLQWACASIGAILVTINPAYRLNELVATLNLVGVSHLFIVPNIRTSSYVSMFANAYPALRESRPGDIQEPSLPHLRHLVVANNAAVTPGEFESALAGLQCAVDWREVMVWREDGREKAVVQEVGASLTKDEVINLQFTSGTTGYPKAVSLTHDNLLNNALSIGRCMRLSPQDVLSDTYRQQATFLLCFTVLMSIALYFVCCLVLTWLTSPRLVLGNLAAWSHGSAVVYPSEIFDPPAIVDAVLHERCTALHGVPTHFLGVLAEVEKRQAAGEKLDLSRLRTGIAAGSSVPINLMKELIEKMNLRDLTNAYGMTETSPVSFQTTPDDPIIKRVETVGKVQPHVRAKIINESGEIVPIGIPGEMCVTGYLVQKGYWKDEEQTASVLRTDEDGKLWMHTGDEGIMDEEGYLRIVGRMKDIIVRGGENLFPVQIENALSAHSAIREGAAVSVPDAKYGEVVGAWVVREPGMRLSREDVRRTVGDNMNPQNAPSWVWFFGEDGAPAEMPKTASGKVQKHILREWSRKLALKGVGYVQRPVKHSSNC